MPYNENKAAEAMLDAFEPARDEKKTKEDKDYYHSLVKDHEYDQHGEKDCDQENGEWYEIPCCEKHEHKEYLVYTPVFVKPYVHLYRPEAKCEGEMRVEPGHKRCEKECNGFEFTLRQKLSVEVPVKYGVFVHYYKPCMEEDK